MNWLWLLAGFGIGVLVEALVSSLYEAIVSTRGILRIDHSDPNKDLYKIEIDDLDALSRKKRVYLKVVKNADLRKNNTSYYETD